MKYIFAFTLISVVLILSGCVSSQDPPKLTLSIDLEDSYEVGEEVSGNAEVKNASGTFYGAVFLVRTKEGYEGKCTSKSKGYSSKHSFTLDAFEINETDGSCSLNTSFETPGTYHFELLVYDCTEIEEELGVSCFDAEEDEIFEGVSPLKELEKTVEVGGGVELFDCEEDDDCFEEKFASCEPAKLTHISSLSGNEELKEILGMENGDCLVRTTYLKFDDEPDWVGKNMVCRMDNSLEFGAANLQMLGTFGTEDPLCEGELFDLFLEKISSMCQEDSECNDNDSETNDYCIDSKCYTVEIEEGVIDCGGAKECFEDMFIDCRPAKLILSVFAGSVVYQYEIISPNNELCEMKSQYLNYSDQSWIGKEMTCSYDNSKSFDDATQEVIYSFNKDEELGDCSGELYTLFTGGSS